MAKGKFDFEKAMARAEEIASAIEQGKVGLEDSIKQFEEGMTLIKRCREVLDDAEERIQKLEESAGSPAAAEKPDA
jgi:exodeoxyribonuclease VII small subunit